MSRKQTDYIIEKAVKRKFPKLAAVISAAVVILGTLAGIFLFPEDFVQDAPSGNDPSYYSEPASTDTSSDREEVSADDTVSKPVHTEITLADIPEYAGEAYVVLNDNIPFFDQNQVNTDSFEYYSELDAIGRCGVCYANLGRDLMPTEDRESISNVRPSGWVNVPYEFVDGKYLYNRCHLIGFQLAGENANEKNLITGTRYMNVEGMLPFENMVADYIKETGDNVLYRITPIYHQHELVARGVQMEAYSVADKGESICFNIYCYNVQPGVVIDYATGESKEDPQAFQGGEQGTFVMNTNNHKFHLPGCSGAKEMNPANRQEFTGSRELLIAQGYKPCGNCDP